MSQGEKVIFFYDDDGKLAAGPESQIPPHLLPEDPDEYVASTFLLSVQPTDPAPRFHSPDAICTPHHLPLHFTIKLTLRYE